MQETCLHLHCYLQAAEQQDYLAVPDKANAFDSHGSSKGFHNDALICSNNSLHRLAALSFPEQLLALSQQKSFPEQLLALSQQKHLLCTDLGLSLCLLFRSGPISFISSCRGSLL